MFERNRPSIFRKLTSWRYIPLLLCIFAQPMQSYANENLNYLVIEEQAAPFQILDKSGKHSGIISDLLFKIFQNSPHNLKVNSFPFKRMIKEINAGLHDNWITYGSSEWSAPQNLNLSECSIITVKHSMLSLKQKRLNFTGLESILNKRLILLFGFEYPNLDELIAAKDVLDLRVLNYESAFKALGLERGIGFVEMESRIKYNLKQTGLSLKDYDLFDLANLIPQYDIRFAFSPDMPKEITHFIDHHCQQLKLSGELDKIVNSYLE